MIRTYLQYLCLLLLAACAIANPYGQNQDHLVLPVFHDYWDDNVNPSFPGLYFDPVKPQIVHDYIGPSKRHEVWGTDDYKLIANDRETSTSYILIRSDFEAKKDPKYQLGQYDYMFWAIRYVPSPNRLGKHNGTLFIRDGKCTKKIRHDQLDWDHFNPAAYAPMIRIGGSCHYDTSGWWNSTSPYVLQYRDFLEPFFKNKL